LLGDMTAAGRRALAQQLLDAPRLYLSTDADPIATRGERHAVCANGSLSLVNPGSRPARRELVIIYTQRRSEAVAGSVTIGSRQVPIETDRRVNIIPVLLPPGTTKAAISVETPGVRCKSVLVDSLPSVSATLRPVARST
jgi:hypothetical protein